jgi:protocatechuate 3,4-dioxygenase beta subunit
MRIGLVLIALAALLSEQNPPAVRDAVRPTVLTGTGRIEGRLTVVGTDPAKPIRRARVALESAGFGETQLADTDIDGRFAFDRLPPGTYRITASKPGFVTMGYGAERHSDVAGAIEVADGAVKTDFGLIPAAALEGRVLDSTGEPIQNLSVSAVWIVHTPEGRRTRTVRQARTDDLGRYRIHSLPPGEYFVQAEPDPAEAATRAAIPEARITGAARTFFPGTARLMDARRLSLSAGQEMAGLELQARMVPLTVVRGRVISSSGSAPAVARVRLRSAAEFGTDPGGFFNPQSAEFEFRAVPPGEYWLTAIASAAANAAPEFFATKISLPDEGTTPRVIQTGPGTTLSIHLAAIQGRSLPQETKISLLPIDTEFGMPPPRGTQSVPPIPVSPATAAVAHVFGPQLFRIEGAPEGWALQGLWLDDVEITDSVTDFRSASAKRTLRIVLTPETGAIEGTLPAGGAGKTHSRRVVVFAVDERHWGPASRFVYATVATGGRFSIRGLLPGSYFVALADGLEPDSWNDPDMLRSLRTQAVSVDVSAGGQHTVALKARAR